MFAVLTEKFGNPNDRGHRYGDEAAEIIAEARSHVAELVSGYQETVTFVRSATVASEKLISRLIRGRPEGKPLRVATTAVEHRAIWDALESQRNRACIELALIGVDSAARLNMAELADQLDKGCDLLCVMAANNEVGTVYPIKEIASLARSANTALLVDGSQAGAAIPFDVETWPISYLILSSHKMYGPKGAAALIANSSFGDILAGLEAEEGTPNVPAIAGFGEACRICASEMSADNARIGTLRDRLEHLLRSGISGLTVNGDLSSRLPHNLHVSIPDVPNDAVVARVSRSVALSTGSACRWGTDQPSHVLEAMALDRTVKEGALRMGLGRFTSAEEIEHAAELLISAVRDIRALTDAVTS